MLVIPSGPAWSPLLIADSWSRNERTPGTPQTCTLAEPAADVSRPLSTASLAISTRESHFSLQRIFGRIQFFKFLETLQILTVTQNGSDENFKTGNWYRSDADSTT